MVQFLGLINGVSGTFFAIFTSWIIRNFRRIDKVVTEHEPGI
jgi:hypothetical protein